MHHAYLLPGQHHQGLNICPVTTIGCFWWAWGERSKADTPGPQLHYLLL